MCRHLLLVSLLISPGIFAAGNSSDRAQPVTIEADDCNANLIARESTCTGNVIIVQGTTRLQGVQISAQQDREDHLFVQGEGKPVRFQQQMDDQSWVKGEAKRFDYDGKAGKLKLRENAWVQHNKDEVRADALNYDIGEKFAEAPGVPGTRMKMVIHPK